MDEKTAQFLPFHAINDFMREDYKAEVIRFTLSELDRLSQDYRDPIERLTRKYVQVVGFRNSSKAPVRLRIKPSCDAFTKYPDFVSAILAAWSALHPELQQMTYQLMVDRNWDVLPLETDRGMLPGFLAEWPKGEDFESIQKAFREKSPPFEVSDDDISLMVVWISGRLPYTSHEDHPSG